ncbi:Arylamine N-acetyltransferase [Paraconexibacter sp. AEG42_29]|uniref:Arylamine N-acetyltransferase n=1 Tax=Paraconexibacter sp. AEG42_29 TaxID=2997339 RepID=A0AAU7AUF6_9ACTN
MPDVERLLARIGLDAAPAADLAGLRAVHRAYLSAMPYDTLAIHLGEFAPLDLDGLLARVTDGGRGGYCFELNGLLAWLLEALGFEVSRHEARVGPRYDDGPTNHLALVVRVPGDDDGSTAWLADAGLGEGWMEPLALVPGVQAGPGRLGWTLERETDRWWIRHHPWGSFPGFVMSDAVVGLDAFAEHHERLSCHPDSSFKRAVVVQSTDDHAVTTLRARTYTRRGPDVDEQRLVTDLDDYADTLLSAFGIDPAALGDTRLERLWHQASAQHDAWTAAGA